ncbi:hypothetical protein L1887_50723 [Cichorium endivia]|nr:hypothetical protein L1887_50723 [Cichorium endivia]
MAKKDGAKKRRPTSTTTAGQHSFFLTFFVLVLYTPLQTALDKMSGAEPASPSVVGAPHRVRIVGSSAAASSSSRNKLLLPPDSIRTLRLQTGDAAIILAEGSEDAGFLVGSVWPSFTLEAGTVRLPTAAHIPASLQAGQRAVVLPLQTAHSAMPLKRPPTAVRLSLTPAFSCSSCLGSSS